MKILVDEMYDGLDETLNNLEGFEAESVKKLIAKGMKMKSDYSVLTYAKENNRILVSADIENQKGCEENKIRFVPLNKVTMLKQILDGIKEIDDSKRP